MSSSAGASSLSLSQWRAALADGSGDPGDWPAEKFDQLAAQLLSAALLLAEEQREEGKTDDGSEKEGNEESEEELLQLIGDACRHEGARSPIGGTEGLIDAVADRLESQSKPTKTVNFKVSRLAARAVGNLCFDHEENRDRFAARGAVQICQKLLARAVLGPENAEDGAADDDDVAESLRSVSGALANLGSGHERVQEEARTCGVLPLLVRALKDAGKTETRLSAVAGSCLALVTRAACNLSDPVESRRALLEAGLVPAVRDMLPRFEDDDFADTLLADATTLMWNLLESDSGGDVQREALSQGALAVFERVFRIGAAEGDMDVSDGVVEALDDLCGDAGAVSAAVAKTALVAQLMGYSRWFLESHAAWLSQPSERDSDEAKAVRGKMRKAVRVLSSLSQDDEAHAALFDSKVMAWLVQDFVMRWKPNPAQEEEAAAGEAAAAALAGPGQTFGNARVAAVTQRDEGSAGSAEPTVDTEVVLSALLMGTNMARSAEACGALLALDGDLFPQILRLLNVHTDLRVHHASIGFMRNMAIVFENRVALLELGWLDSLQTQLRKADKPNPLVLYSAITALRPLLAAASVQADAPSKPADAEVASAWECATRLLEGGGFEALIELGRGDRGTPEAPENDIDEAAKGGKASDGDTAEDKDGEAKEEAAAQPRDRRIEYEASRVLARLASGTPVSDDARKVTERVCVRLVQGDAVVTLLGLVTSPYDILQVEGLRALRDMALFGEVFCEGLKANAEVLAAVHGVETAEAQQSPNAEALRQSKESTLAALGV